MRGYDSLFSFPRYPKFSEWGENTLEEERNMNEEEKERNERKC